jgi:hypothetical protein
VVAGGRGGDAGAGWWMVGPGRQRWGPGGVAGGLFFWFYKNLFAESWVGLSAHVRRVGYGMLSAKTASPVQCRREAFAESFLSPKPSTRG